MHGVSFENDEQEAMFESQVTALVAEGQQWLRREAEAEFARRHGLLHVRPLRLGRAWIEERHPA